MKEEMNLYKKCKNIFKTHGVDMGGGSGSIAPVLEFVWESNGEVAGQAIVSTELTWSDIANAIKSNPNTVAHIISGEDEYISFPLLSFHENDELGEAVFALSGVIYAGATEGGSPIWRPYGGLLSVGYESETGEMWLDCVINMGP